MKHPVVQRAFSFMVLLLVPVSVNSCGSESVSTSMQLIGDDERVPLGEHTYQNTIGALVFEGSAVCTAFAIDEREIVTASHCYDDKRQGDYSFRSELGEYDVRGGYERYEHLDLVTLELQHAVEVPPLRIEGLSIQELNEDQERIEQLRTRPIFENYFELSQQDSSTEFVGGVRVVSHARTENELLFHEVIEGDFVSAGEADSGFFFHTLDTVSGSSGSPILNDGQVIGIHLGATVNTESNFGVWSHTFFEEVGPDGESTYNIADHIYVGECVEADVQEGSPTVNPDGTVSANVQVKYDVSGCVDDAISLSLDLIPGVSNVKSLIEAVVGMDIVTWEGLTPAEQALTLSAVFVGPAAKAGAKSIKIQQILADVGMSAKKIAGKSGSIALSKMTPAQLKNTSKVDNIIANNAKPHDFEGVRKEISGQISGINPATGQPWNHVKEMQQSVTGLEKSIVSIENSLKNPNLDSNVRIYLNAQLSRAREVSFAMKDALNGN